MTGYVMYRAANGNIITLYTDVVTSPAGNWYPESTERKTMKEKYLAPETEIVIFESEDVITASGDIDGDIE